MALIDPKSVKTSVFHSFMLGAIAPRPIAFASTVDKDGNPNLSPYSFFNAFGSNPPVIVFSPARRVRDNTIKHTLENIRETMEVVINVVSYPMVHQMSLSSSEFPKGVNEFQKAGFTQVPSSLVKPPRVKESPVQLECKVLQVIETGSEGGAGNLIVCEILLMHIDDAVLDANGKIDPHKIDLVARMGGDWYCRASGTALFEVPKPLSVPGIGVDHLPESIRLSTVLTGNDLGRLGNLERMPTKEEIAETMSRDFMRELRSRFGSDRETFSIRLHELAKALIEKGDAATALKVLACSIS
jgi:flavin reductase (DIM6/NTAB) family NADH-FMN oxidoreductase RutF